MYQRIVTPRTQPVITPEQLSAFGRFTVPEEGGSDYLLLQTMIEAATDEVENMAATACMYEQVQETYDYFPGQQDPREFFNLSYQYTNNPFWWYGFPTKDSIELVRRPVVVPNGSPVVNNVVVGYNDTTGNAQVMDPSTYTVFADKIILNVGQSWPLTDRRQDCVQMTYWAGYSSTDTTKVPSRLQMAIMYLANHFYQVRQIVSVEQTYEVSTTLCRMLNSYRSMRIPR